ncbi:SRPBCC family protein [Thiocapsa marina]|uniref:Polyketide cyclase/dehydrase n=1 Tax=Thiocapsa marina 5811 TaxID=768671 RepID=F9UEL2_9GAMM|nr:SRPBCC family protein [Thiocapsa marina]EGV17333.1 Polyketide cyclase/dehydrase [Thiocapsa marina 5811]
MVKTQVQTLIRLPPAQVYSFVAEDFLRNYPRWSPEVQSLQAVTEGPIRVGWIGRQIRVDQGRRTDSRFRVVALEPGRRVSFKGTTDPYVIEYRFDPLGEHTHLTFIFELAKLNLALRPFEKLIRVAAQDGAERVTRNLKGLIEAELGAPA